MKLMLLFHFSTILQFDRMHSEFGWVSKENSLKCGGKKSLWNMIMVEIYCIHFMDFIQRLLFWSHIVFLYCKRIQHFNKKFLYLVLIGTFPPSSAVHKSYRFVFFFRPSLERIHRRHFYRYQLMVLKEYYSFREHWTCITYVASAYSTLHNSGAQCHTIPLKMNNVPFSSYMIPTEHTVVHILLSFLWQTHFIFVKLDFGTERLYKK